MKDTTTDFRKKLLDRTLNFSENLIKFVVRLPKDLVNEVLRKQIIRSATSIGANYREACEAESADDFVHKVRISKKEAGETAYWLELLLRINPGYKLDIDILLKETLEFIRIFSSISSKFKRK